jgi:hypothetical protein
MESEEKAMVAASKAIHAVQQMIIALREAGADPWSLATARTQFEAGFLWAKNAAGGEPILHA